MSWTPFDLQVFRRAAVKKWATAVALFTIATSCVYAWNAGRGADPTTAPEFLTGLVALVAALVKLARIVRPRRSTPAQRAAFDGTRQGRDHWHPDIESRLDNVERELGVVQDAVVSLQDTQAETQRTLVRIVRRQDDDHRVLNDVRASQIRIVERMDQMPEVVADVLEPRMDQLLRRHFPKPQPSTVLEPDVTELVPVPEPEKES